MNSISRDTSNCDRLAIEGEVVKIAYYTKGMRVQAKSVSRASRCSNINIVKQLTLELPRFQYRNRYRCRYGY